MWMSLLLAAAASTTPPAVDTDARVAAGLAAYRRLHFKEAAAEFQAAHDQDPHNAAAAWYLAYTVYMAADRRRPFDPDKRRAAELFAQAYDIDPHFLPKW
jgi:tetratricopeptide (TPR) repeat protein